MCCDAVETSQALDNGQHTSHQPKSYRSKPPSGLRRDTIRCNNWATSKQLHSSTKGPELLSQDRYRCGSHDENDTDFVLSNQAGGQNQLLSNGSNNLLLSPVHESGYESLQMNGLNDVSKSMSHTVVSPSLQQHSTPDLTQCKPLTSTPTQTACEGSHAATQTAEPLTNSQSVATTTPTDMSLQTILPDNEVKQQQTDEVLSEEVSTQYCNPCACSQDSMTMPQDIKHIGVATDPYPSRHMQTLSVKTENKKTGARTVSDTTQTDPTAESSTTQTDPVLISKHPKPWVQTVSEYVQEKALELKQVQAVLHDLQRVIREDGIT